MATITSKLKAISPAKWGYRKVNIVFGVVRPTQDQSCALSGDLIQNIENGSVWEFKYREGDNLRGIPVRR
jgi:hypothetical protein